MIAGHDRAEAVLLERLDAGAGAGFELDAAAIRQWSVQHQRAKWKECAPHREEMVQDFLFLDLACHRLGEIGEEGEARLARLGRLLSERRLLTGKLLNVSLDQPMEVKTSTESPLDSGLSGHYLAPCAFEIDSIRSLEQENFGPILHIVRYPSSELDRVIDEINPILRGWVGYFRVGHASRCFGYVKDWVEKKIRRHMMRARKRKGFGWKRWSRRWLYEALGLFNSYRVRRPVPKVAPAR